MIDVIQECQRLLGEADIATLHISGGNNSTMAFEGATTLGFIIVYDDTQELLQDWQAYATELIQRHQLSLRRAQTKAWNTYMVLLAKNPPEALQQIALSALEEDLSGTRKIARGGISDAQDVRAALLPLLPIQNAPRLQTVDMPEEIRLRVSELPDRVVEAFLSDVQDAQVIQVFEEMP